MKNKGVLCLAALGAAVFLGGCGGSGESFPAGSAAGGNPTAFTTTAAAENIPTTPNCGALVPSTTPAASTTTATASTSATSGKSTQIADDPCTPDGTSPSSKGQ